MTLPAPSNGASAPVPPTTPVAQAPTAKASTPTSSTTEVVSPPSNISSSALPQHCASVQPQAGSTVILCQPPTEAFLSKALPTIPALGTSVLALILSGYALRYNFSKDARTRRQSIQDDFWLRKVVSPVSIEPFVKFTSELLVSLPSAASSQQEREAFSTNRLAEFRALTVSFQALALLSPQLSQTVESQLEAIEDRLAKYLGELDAFAKGNSAVAPGRPEAIADLSALRLGVLEPIKDHQADLGE